MFRVRREDFDAFVRAGVATIPARFRALIRNAAFVVEEQPSAAQRKRMDLRRGETLLGLYEGVPRTARGGEYGGLVMPDKITIFKQPIEEAARDSCEEDDAVKKTERSNNLRPRLIATPDAVREKYLEAVRKIVIDTVWHEVAHHFGLDEGAVAEREKRRVG